MLNDAALPSVSVFKFTWRKADSLEAVAKSLRMSPEQVLAYAGELRKKGVSLPHKYASAALDGECWCYSKQDEELRALLSDMPLKQRWLFFIKFLKARRRYMKERTS